MSKMMQTPVNRVLASTQGHIIRFFKNQPTLVPNSVVEEAMGIGAVVVDPQGEDDDAGGTNPEGESQSPAPTKVSRKEAIYEAVDTLLVSGDRDDFTAANKPKVSAVRERTGFSVERKEIDEALRERNRRLAEQRLDED